MFFEGSEKKFELISHHEDFLSYPDSFWREIVSQAKATIISSLSNSEAKAFLLSESSLFVFKNRLLMITCGKTQLISAVKKLSVELGQDKIDHLYFQRKNEYYSHLQPSHFVHDAYELLELFPGQCYRFGQMDEHHNYLYVKNSELSLERDKTFECLMYHIGVNACNFLTKQNLKIEEVRSFLGLNQWLKEYQIDDYLFEPFGYSLNALNGTEYVTIHITPQENSSYVSVEGSAGLGKALPHLIEAFSPGSIDLVTFEHLDHEEFTIPEQYYERNLSEGHIQTGHKVQFQYLTKERDKKSAPYLFDQEDIYQFNRRNQ